MVTPTSAVFIDETVEMLLDAGTAVTEALADSLPFEELDALLRELTAEILDVYRTVTDDLATETEEVHR